jgi:hypothetical protein
MMSNSLLVNYTKISPNKSSPRNHAIDTITIHCVAGNCTVETIGSIFSPASRKASSNYGVGTDGRIGLYCDESDRSWCTSSASNDNRAVTIEVANDGDAETGWHVSDVALRANIKLVADICKRNNIKKLLWKGDKSLIGNVTQQNMTVHRWFAAKSCPGDYLYGKHGYIADEVNKILGSNETPSGTPPAISFSPYLVRIAASALNVRSGAGTSFKVVKCLINDKNVYTIVEEAKGNDGLTWGKLKSGIGWIALKYTKKA